MSILPSAHDSVSESSIDKSVPVYKVEMGTSVVHDEPALGSDMIPDEEQPRWPKIRSIWQDAFSEFLGTMILLLFGDGVVAQVVLSNGAKGSYQSISWGWG
jgi:aquaglyceroporin related protein